MRKFVKNTSSKIIPFMGDEITITKLSAGAVKRIGAASKELDPAEDSMKILTVILHEGVVLPKGEEPINEELLEEFPLDELNNLSNAIMEFAGLNANAAGNDS